MRYFVVAVIVLFIGIQTSSSAEQIASRQTDIKLNAIERSLEIKNPIERFRFHLKWGFMSAGHSLIQMGDNDEGGISIISSAVSADWFSAIYTVDDYVESMLDNGPESFYPNWYHIRTREGKHYKDREVFFKRDKGIAVYVDHINNKRKEYEIPQDVYDPLSIFFKVRSMKLEVGKSVYVPLFDSKKLWNVEVKVLRKETVKVPAGTFDTIVIKPILKSEGIFNRKGDIYIWLTDDEKHMPVKLKSKILVGSVSAYLTGGVY